MSGELENCALIVVDLQHDFLPPDGALAVKHGDSIVPKIIRLLQLPWAKIIATKDFHPKGHYSFASTWGLAPFSSKAFQNPGGTGESKEQVVWPDHCVQGEYGSEFPAEFSEALKDNAVVKKGYLKDREYYSAFNDTWGLHKTELDEILKAEKIQTVYLVGLAYDFCVLHTGISASELGYKTVVLKDLSRSVYPENDRTTDAMYEKNDIEIMDSGIFHKYYENRIIPGISES